MRLIRVCGLAAVVVATFMAIAEVGSAMAVTELEKVVWCLKREQMCPANQDFPAGTELFAAATSEEFLSNIGNVSCSSSEILMTNTGLLVHGNVTALAFGECKLGETKCAVTAEHLEYLFKGELKSDNSKYEIKVTEKGTNGAPQATVECGAFVHCTYAANEVSIEAKLAFTPERLSILQEFIVSKGAVCAKNMTWHATYNVECREEVAAEIKKCWEKMES